MPRYFFNFREGTKYSADDEGSDFDSVEAAYLEVFRTAQEMWSELLLQKRDPRDCAFEIVDGAGTSLIVMPFSEVLEACSGKAAAAPAEFPRPYFDAISSQARARRLCSDLAEQVQQAHTSLARTRALLERSRRRPAAGA